jgi:hypothetical protein
MTTNTGNSAATCFGSIPINDQIEGNIRKSRIAASNSPANLKGEDNLFGDNVMAFVEGDFTGNDAADVFVTSNSHTYACALRYFDWKHGSSWEFLGGQTWSVMPPNCIDRSTPDRNVFTTLNVDRNDTAGLVSARQAQARVICHSDEHWAAGISIENSDQFVDNEVTFRFAFNATMALLLLYSALSIALH